MATDFTIRKHRRSFFELVQDADRKLANDKPLTAAERKAVAERDERKAKAQS